MLERWQDVCSLLKSPSSGWPLGSGKPSPATAEFVSDAIDFVNDQPILIERGSRFVDYDAVLVRGAVSQVERSARWEMAKGIRGRIGRSGAGIAGQTDVLASHLSGISGRKPVVLVIGGGTVGVGLEEMLASDSVSVISFDIYASANTTFVGDAHNIMVQDDVVDAVWIQAVLEHVEDPVRVVAEIVRVLRPNGLVLAETPFLQPVHEGAFDFTRYTMSGHRLLFGRFSELASGPLGGPGAMMALAVRGLGGGLLRSRLVETPLYVVAGAISMLDRLVAMPWRRDFATGCYFVGRLTAEPERLILSDMYLGRQRP